MIKSKVKSNQGPWIVITGWKIKANHRQEEYLILILEKRFQLGIGKSNQANHKQEYPNKDWEKDSNQVQESLTRDWKINTKQRQESPIRDREINSYQIQDSGMAEEEEEEEKTNL